MLNSINIVYLIIFAVVAVVVAISVLYKVLDKKNIDLTKTFEAIENVNNTAGTILKATKEMLPNNKVVDILEIIQKWTSIGVGNAEQLYKSNKLSADERKPVAENTIYSILKELNIEPTEAQKKLIDISIENAVNALGHKEVPADVAALQQQIADLQQQIAIKTNTLNQVQNSLQPALQVLNSQN